MTSVAISALPAATLSTSSSLVLADGDGSLAGLINAVGYAAQNQPAGTNISYTDSILAVVGGEAKLIPVGDLPAQNIPASFSSSVSGTFTASEILLNATCLATTIFPENLTGSTFSFSGTATANASLNITNNGTIIGAIAVPAGSGTGTATLSTATTLTTGSVFEILAPTAPDATLAGASIQVQATGLGQTTGIYLGSFASAPTSGVGGAALIAGDLYFNTGTAELYEYNGSIWSAISGGSGISGVKVTDGTNTVSSASTIVVSGGTVSSTGTTPTVATITVTGGGGSTLSIGQGTTTVGSVTSLTIAGSGGTLSSGSANHATLTLSGSGTSSVVAPACFPGIGEAFNWATGQWKRPALSAMTVFFPASNAATITEIGSGLSGPIKYLNGNNTVIPILGQAPPSSGPWTATVLIETLAFENQGSFVGLIAVDASNNALLSFIDGGVQPPTINLQSGHLSISGTGTAQSATYPFASSIASANLYMTPMLLWMRFRYDGAVYWSEISHDGDIWQGYDSGGTVGSLTGPAVIVGLTSTALSVNYFKLYSFSIVSGGSAPADGTY